jgi:hypothetical protein
MTFPYPKLMKPRLGARLDKGNRRNRGLVASYLLNENGGNTILDATGNRHTGTITGATWVPFCDGPGIQFATPDSFISYGTPTALKPPVISIVATVRCDIVNAGAFGTIYGAAYNCGAWLAIYGSYLAFYTTTVGSAYDEWLGVGEFTSPPIPAWTAGTTRQVVATWDGITKRVYIDGMFVDSRTPAGKAGNLDWSTATSIRTGTDQTQTYDLYGTVGEVSVYNRVLTIPEIQQLATQPFAGISRGYPLELFAGAMGGGEVGATSIAAGSQTGTRTAIALDAPVGIAAGSQTPTRAAAGLDTEIVVAADSRTSARSSLVVNVTAALSAASRTVPRVSLAVDSAVVLAAVSRTPTRLQAQLAVTDTVLLGAHSDTPIRVAAQLNTLMTVAGRCQVATRVGVGMAATVGITALGRVDTRLVGTLDTSIVIAADSRTATRGVLWPGGLATAAAVWFLLRKKR